jgi:hypothetical protein
MFVGESCHHHEPYNRCYGLVSGGMFGMVGGAVGCGPSECLKPPMDGGLGHAKVLCHLPLGEPFVY